MLSRLQGVDGLPRNTQASAKLCLAPISLCTKHLEAVIHVETQLGIPVIMSGIQDYPSSYGVSSRPDTICARERAILKRPIRRLSAAALFRCPLNRPTLGATRPQYAMIIDS